MENVVQKLAIRNYLKELIKWVLFISPPLQIKAYPYYIVWCNYQIATGQLILFDGKLKGFVGGKLAKKFGRAFWQ